MGRERSETQRMWITGSTLGVGVMLALALFVLVNYLSLRHYHRFDLTSSKLYSLSEKSEKVVAALDREIEAVVFLTPDSELYTQANELLTRFEAINPQMFKKRVIDPARNLLEAQQLVERHEIEHENVIVLATDSDRRVIDEADLVEYDYSGVQFGQSPTVKEFRGEQLITSALLALVEAKKPKILFTSGHGEGRLEIGERSLSQARDLLGKDNFEIEEWSSLGKPEVPADTDLLVIAGPTTNFLEPELEVLSNYLDGGGRMLVFVDPVFAPGIDGLVDLGLGGWLAKYGVELRDDIVVDPTSELPFFGPETIFTDFYGSHPIVESLAETRTRVLLPLARSVSPSDSPPEGLEITELVRTSGDAWGETDLANLDQIDPGDDDVSGPVSLGLAVTFAVDSAGDEIGEATDAEEDLEAEIDDPDVFSLDAEDEDGGEGLEARLVVYGDFDFATDAQVMSAANRILLLNTFNWLVKREELIDIEGKKPKQTSLSLSRTEISNVYLLVMLVMPGLAVVTGIGVYRRRRR